MPRSIMYTFFMYTFFLQMVVGLCAGGSQENKEAWKEKYQSLNRFETKQQKRHVSGHTNTILDVDVSPGGHWIVTAGRDGDVIIWDVESGAPELLLDGHRDEVWGVAVSPSGRYIATGSVDRDVRIWDRVSGKTLHRLEGHTERIWSVDYSPNGLYIASSSHDRTTKIWDAQKGKLIRTINPDMWSYACQFTGDGQSLVVGYPAKAILWDVASGIPIQTFNVGGHENYIMAIAVTRDGDRVATGGLDKTITHWNVKTGDKIFELGDHKGHITSIDYSPDGEWLLTTAREQQVLLWRVRTGELAKKFISPGISHSAKFSSDGRYAVVAYDRHVVIFDLESGEPVQEFLSH